MIILREFWSSLRSHMATMSGLYITRRMSGEPGHGHVLVPLWARLLWVYVGGPLFALEQYWMCWLWHERGWPAWPGTLASRLFYRLNDALEPFGTPMQWNAPDSGIPGEIGFWSVDDGSHERSQVRWFISAAGPHTSGSAAASYTVSP